MFRLVGCALLLALSGSAYAADWYVDQAAAAGGDGSQAHPFQTINAALAGLSRGDTVWIASGTYDETVNIANLPGSAGETTFRAQPNATVTIDGTSGSSAAGFVVQTSVPDTTFQNLTIANGVDGAIGIQMYYADGGKVLGCVTTNVTSNAVNFYYSSQGTVSSCKLEGDVGGRKTSGTLVENSEVYGSSAEGIGLYDNSTGCTVRHNVIHDNTSVNLYLDSVSHSTYDGNLIYQSAAGSDVEGIEISDEGHYPAADLPAPVNSYNTIINNVIVNHAVGIAFWMSDEWATQDLQNQSGLRYDVIANNTLVNNVGGIRWDASPAHVGTTIQNNLVYAATGSSPAYLLDAKSSGGISLDHNLWFAPDLAQPYLWVGDQTDHPGFVAASMQGAADVLADPLLVGPLTVPPATNLALQIDSPAIGAGVVLASVPDDYLGAARPATGNDVGAFEYGAVVVADGGGTPDGSVFGPDDAGSIDADEGATASKTSHGCDVGAHGPMAPVVLVAVVLVLLARRRQSV